MRRMGRYNLSGALAAGQRQDRRTIRTHPTRRPREDIFLPEQNALSPCLQFLRRRFRQPQEPRRCPCSSGTRYRRPTSGAEPRPGAWRPRRWLDVSRAAEFGRDRQTSVLQIEQQFTPILRALARAVGKAEQLLPALRRRADDDQEALLGVFKTGLQVNAVGPHIGVVLGRQIALPPVLVLVDPDLLQPSNSRGRQARCILAEQGSKRLLEIAGRDALKSLSGNIRRGCRAFATSGGLMLDAGRRAPCG